MISKEDIKKVEKLQKIDREIDLLKEDYRNIMLYGIGYREGYAIEFFNKNYDKCLKIVIKNRIRILKKEREKLIKE